MFLPLPSPRLRAGLLVGLLLFTSEALALMPPHIQSTQPANGGELHGDTLVMIGYSLEYADLSELTVVDAADDHPVEFTTDLSCTWEGDDPPGHVGGRQQRCELRVSLSGLQLEHRYRANLMDTRVEFTWAGPSVPSDPDAPVTAPEGAAAPAVE